MASHPMRRMQPALRGRITGTHQRKVLTSRQPRSRYIQAKQWVCHLSTLYGVPAGQTVDQPVSPAYPSLKVNQIRQWTRQPRVPRGNLEEPWNNRRKLHIIQPAGGTCYNPEIPNPRWRHR